MTGEIEATADALTGGLVGRAVEPAHGEAAGVAAPRCLNCATALVGDYCHNCGQAGHVHRSLAAIGHDISHGVLHVEGKIWRTLPLLAFKPGDLTRRYIRGERARFVSPMALFLFSVFLMFAVFSALGGSVEPRTVATPEARAELASEREAAAARVATLEAQRRAETSRGASTAATDAALADARRERDALGMLDDGVFTGLTIDRARVRTGWERLDAGIAKANENPGLLLYKVQTNAYKFSWALIPISVPFVWLLFAWRRGLHAYDHAVFVTYSLSFMMLLVIALTLLGAVGVSDSLLVPAALLVPPLHIYKQLRYAYALGRAGAAWRTVALILFSGIAATSFALLLLGLGVLG